MNVTAYLDVNGVLSGGYRKVNGFELPDERKVLTSIRFGDHALDPEQKFLMILPLKGVRNAARDGIRRENRTATADKTSSEKQFRHRLMTMATCLLTGCKARAAAFFW